MTADSQDSPKNEQDVDEVIDESVTDDENLYKMRESSLAYFGADFDVAGLVQRLRNQDIVIPRFDPDESENSTLDGFQRQRVWPKKKMEQFIESLLLGWPVPSIFLVLDADQRYLVLDGQQRLTALEQFFEGSFADGTPFKLHEVADHLQNASYETLSPESQRKLRNTFIQATVIEPQGKDGPESIYRLFGRLNSGGVSLTAQEIRVALFLGPVVEWIRQLNKDENWRHLYGASSPRLKDHEIVLRALAMERVHERVGSNWQDTELRKTAYQPPMSEFLNNYLKDYRKLNGIDSQSLTKAFRESTRALYAAVGKDGLRFNGRINAAHVDAVISALMRLSQADQLPDKSSLTSALNQLRRNVDYAEFVTRSTSHRENVYGRLQLALETLA